VNIRTWDQGPSLLVKDQVHALVDTLLDFDAENSFVFIHCAGGMYFTKLLLS
jgi:protein-tyrosine phosphatase